MKGGSALTRWYFNCVHVFLLKKHAAFKWKDAISRFPLSPGSTEAPAMWGGKIKYILIAYFLGNICAKNCRNRAVYVKITARCKGGTFLTHGVYQKLCTRWPPRRNHMCQVSKSNFPFYRGSNFPFSYWYLNGPYNSAVLLRCLWWWDKNLLIQINLTSVENKQFLCTAMVMVLTTHGSAT